MLIKTAPIPISEQPWFINAVAQIRTHLTPHELIKSLLEIECKFGRERDYNNEARVIDLDLICYNRVYMKGKIVNGVEASIPHPRMTGRKFVLQPLHELCPTWIHPKTGISLKTLLKNLDEKQAVQII